MELNIEIGPYKLSKRTEYSKIQLYDKNTGENITNTQFDIFQKIISDYNKQLKNPDKYFDIDDNKLIKLQTPKDIEYIFIPKEVSIIGDYSCSGSYMHYIHFPNTVHIIKKGAFRNCTKLKSIDIPDNVINIEDAAFNNCTDLSDVKLSNCITSLSEETFLNCSSLKSIKLPEILDMIDDHCFSGCAFEGIILPDNVSEIWSYAFSDCKNLEYVKLPKSLDILSSGLFYGCEKLKKLILPDNISGMRGRLFASLSNGDVVETQIPEIENINIPKNLDTIIDRPFEHSKVKSLTFNHDLKELDFISILSNPKNHDLLVGSKINKLIIDRNVKVLTSRAFEYNGEQITSIDYLGTKEEFNEFKNNNEELFKVLPYVKEINTIINIEIDKNRNMDDILI